MSKPVIGILVGGGPSPGINGVISAAVIKARKKNLKVIGFYEGFKWLAKREEKIKELHIRDVSRIHSDGGSILRISREGSFQDPQVLDNVVYVLNKLGITHLIVIGGDGTAYSSYLLHKKCEGSIKIVHVPKTIDNDLPLPGTISSFGFQSARHAGVDIVDRIMEDSFTVGRWYFLVTMGRKAGHLALGIGQSSGATVTVIPEEFKGRQVTLREIADVLEGAILKRMAMGHRYGVALLAEGLLAILKPEELEHLQKADRDPSGHVRFSELNLGHLLKDEVTRRLRKKELPITVVSKNLGYELRCAPPIPFDQEYTRTLGYGATNSLLKGTSGVLICLKDQNISPIPLSDLLDETGKRIRLRHVDINRESYKVAREYMIRLQKRDLEDEQMFQKLLKYSKMTKEEFLDQYAYLTE